jgi:hypothetical protein
LLRVFNKHREHWLKDEVTRVKPKYNLIENYDNTWGFIYESSRAKGSTKQMMKGKKNNKNDGVQNTNIRE